jgi:predicted peptidase
MRGDLSERALILAGKAMLDGRVALPHAAVAAAIFASAPALEDEARDAHIIALLYGASVATIYTPLLTDDELQFDAHTAHFRHDAELLAQRFIDIAQWVHSNRNMGGMPLAYIGSSGGAAGALVAAAQRPDLVATVVSIDGRTDLASDHLRTLTVPTLLVVRDMPVLRMNREALSKIRAERRIEVVHGADAGATDTVVQKTVRWVEERLALVAV